MFELEVQHYQYFLAVSGLEFKVEFSKTTGLVGSNFYGTGTYFTRPESNEKALSTCKLLHALYGIKYALMLNRIDCASLVHYSNIRDQVGPNHMKFYMCAILILYLF